MHRYRLIFMCCVFFFLDSLTKKDNGINEREKTTNHNDHKSSMRFGQIFIIKPNFNIRNKLSFKVKTQLSVKRKQICTIFHRFQIFFRFTRNCVLIFNCENSFFRVWQLCNSRAIPVQFIVIIYSLIQLVFVYI